MKFALVTLLGAASLAAAQPHNHVHRHPARHGSPVEARDASVTETVPGPVVTVYELNGIFIPWAIVEAGIKSGKYVLMGDKISTVQPSASATPTPSTSSTSSTSTTPTPTPAPSTSSTEAAQFIEKSSSSSSTTPTSTSAVPTTSSTSAAPVATTTAASSSSSSSSDSSNSNANVDVPFPTDDADLPDCTDFPSAYGAVAAPWLNLGGYTGIQQVSGYTFDVSDSISDIVTVVGGSLGDDATDYCTPGSFCSYACPPGYQKSQWPSAQGSTGQSIGGLYCNTNGKLQLSRSSASTICTAGVGNVNVYNKLSQNVSICRTDYPGTESETILLNAIAGATLPVTNPDANDYYSWKNLATSAQYYINPAGYGPGDACVWGESGTNLGNWAPVNMGVGKATTGETFISIFPNTPTNPDGTLDFTITITGGVSDTTCMYKNGAFSYQGSASSSGCTVSVNDGETALFTFE